MSFNNKQLEEALAHLGLDPKREHTKQEIARAYKIRALQVHPDKAGGSHDAFLALSQAFKTASDRTSQASATCSNTVVEAMAALYITLDVALKCFDAYEKTANNIPYQELKYYLNDTATMLRENISLEDYQQELLLNSLKKSMRNLQRAINTVSIGASPAFKAMVGGILIGVIIALGVLAIALWPPLGVTLSTTALWILAIAPPVAGFAMGTVSFFAATNAEKNLSAQKALLNGIIEGIESVITAVNEPNEAPLANGIQAT